MFERAFQEDIERPQFMGDTGFAVTPPAAAAPEFAVQPPVRDAAPSIDTTAYLAANPDIAAYYAGSPEQQALYGDVNDFALRHYQNTGINENRPGVVPVKEIPKSGMVVDPFRPQGAPVQPTVAPTAVPLGADPSLAVQGGNPDFGMYSGSANQYVAPQLQPANDRFSTPYYAAYTNDNDLAGAVMVGDQQKVRLVDGKTGQVVFEGVGPAAAQQAVGIANAVSEDKGRKASWAIQADYGPEKGWVSQAAERYDPKKTGVWGTLLDIAAPIILNAVLPGLGGALGGALGTFGGRAAMAGIANLGSGLIQGESLKNAGLGALTSGLTSGAIGGVLDKFPTIGNAVNGVMRPVNNFAADVANATGLRAVLDPVNQGLVHVIDAGGSVVHTLQGGVDAAQDWIKGAASNAVSGVTNAFNPATNVGGFNTVAPVDINFNPGFAINPGVPGFNIPTGGGGGTPNTVEELTVTGQRPVDPGLPVLTPAPGGGYDSSEIDVTGREPERPTLTPTNIPDVYDSTPIDVTGAPPTTPGLPTPSVPTPISPVDLDGLTVMPPPAQDPGIVTTVPPVIPPVVNPGIPSTGGQNTGGKYSINSNAGTRASLSPIFSASLPSPTFGGRTPRAVNVDQRYAIERPEGRFFEQVGTPQGPSQFAVPTPSQARLQGVGDLNNDGVVDDLDLAVWRRRFGGQGYARGGSAQGDGRSDSIDARLSDGEYVIDAETVALLGNGSSDAGARKLDEFRVKVRRDKGRDLAKGKFSRAARDPHDYLEGR